MDTPVTWKVVSQQQTQQFDPNGNPINGKNVTIETTTGYKGSVFVPDSVYSQPDQVKELLANEAKSVVAVHGLTGTVR